MPNYSALAEQGIYTLGSGIRVFAGTVDEPKYGDMGAFYDTLDLRTAAGGGVLSAAADANDSTNIAPDLMSGYNVNSIAIEVPIAMLTRTGAIESATSTAATIGVWGSTARPRTLLLRAPLPPVYSGTFSQIERMGNPLISDLLIGQGSKAQWAMSLPVNDSQFAPSYLDPVLARQMNAIYGIAIPTPQRTDLLPLITYALPIAASGTPVGPIADMLRLNTGVPPTPMGSRRRLGLLAGDAAGFPNGRRVSNDVFDISLRFTAGILAGPQFSYPFGDGVNTNAFHTRKPFRTSPGRKAGDNAAISIRVSPVARWVPGHRVRRTKPACRVAKIPASCSTQTGLLADTNAAPPELSGKALVAGCEHLISR